jgi:hypothetical protein
MLRYYKLNILLLVDSAEELDDEGDRGFEDGSFENMIQSKMISNKLMTQSTIILTIGGRSSRSRIMSSNERLEISINE